MAIEIVIPRLIEITPENFTEACETHSLETKDAATALSFAFHYNKMLFLDIDERSYLWKERSDGDLLRQV